MITITEIIENLSSSPVITNKKITAKTKKADAYIYAGGGYDTETTTLKKDVVRIGYSEYDYDTVKQEYTIYEKDKAVKHTYKGEYYKKPVLAFVYHVQIIIKGQYITFRKIQDAADFLISLSEALKKHFNNYRHIKITNYPRLIIWVANLNFEWQFIKTYLDKCMTSYFAKNKTTPLSITINDTIELRECIGLFGTSLENIANNFTETKKLKGDLDYNKIRVSATPLTEKEQEYCYNDVKILDELSYKAHDMYTMNKLKIPLSNTGIVRQDMRVELGGKISFEYYNNSFIMPPTEELYFEWRKFLYQGGYAHSNSAFVGKELNNVVCADITSDYPYQINSKTFPAGELIHCEDKTLYKSVMRKYKHKLLKVIFKSIHAKTTHTYISKHKIMNHHIARNCIYDNGRLYSGENITLWLTEVDIKIISTLYTGKFDILDLWYFTKSKSAPKFITTVMNRYYRQKEVLKSLKKDNTFEYKWSKVLVNSVYGMCSTGIYTTKTVYNNIEFCDLEDSSFNYETQKKKMWLNPFIGYYTTAYARATLVQLISRYPNVIVQYDTDSIFIWLDSPHKKEVKALLKEIERTNRIIESNNLLQFNDIHMKTIGTWELENPYKRFKCLGAKRYIALKQNGEYKTAIAGCNKDGFLNHCKNNNIDPFDFFSSELKLSFAESNKLMASYGNDREDKTITVTDCNGVTEDVIYRTYCALYEVPFKFNMDVLWFDVLKDIEYYNRQFPAKYRTQNILESEIL